MRVYDCSSNQGKLREFALVASELGFNDIQLAALPGLRDILPPEETGSSFEENAALKARFYSHQTAEIVLADDSGLEVDALNGAPGIHSARYAGADATDQANNARLIDNMRRQHNRAAKFVCAIALARDGNLLHMVRGEVHGQLLERARGTNGFGYDPLFFYPPLDASFGELSDTEKFAISHRGRAVRSALEWLARLNG